MVKDRVPRNVADRGGGGRGPQRKAEAKTGNQALGHEASRWKKPANMVPL